VIDFESKTLCNPIQLTRYSLYFYGALFPIVF